MLHPRAEYRSLVLAVMPVEGAGRIDRDDDVRIVVRSGPVAQGHIVRSAFSGGIHTVLGGATGARKCQRRSKCSQARNTQTGGDA